MHAHKLVAVLTALQLGKALALEPENLFRLGPGRNLETYLAINGIHLPRHAERRLRKGNVDIAQEIGAVTLEEAVRRFMDEHDEVARGAAVGTRIALIRNRDIVAFRDTCRNGDINGILD